MKGNIINATIHTISRAFVRCSTSNAFYVNKAMLRKMRLLYSTWANKRVFDASLGRFHVLDEVQNPRAVTCFIVIPRDKLDKAFCQSNACFFIKDR